MKIVDGFFDGFFSGYLVVGLVQLHQRYWKLKKKNASSPSGCRHRVPCSPILYPEGSCPICRCFWKRLPFANGSPHVSWWNHTVRCPIHAAVADHRADHYEPRTYQLRRGEVWSIGSNKVPGTANQQVLNRCKVISNHFPYVKICFKNQLKQPFRNGWRIRFQVAPITST